MHKTMRGRLLAMAAVAIACALLSSLLPDNPYQRWQLLDNTIHNRAGWIYERIHFDPAPIDVAFLGPSRVGAGIDAPRIEAALRARGMPANVVNFSLPENGRNINYTIAHELLGTKRPRLLVIGVIEKPGRYGHPAFKYVAPAGEVFAPGYLGINYFSDLMYLPFRQLKLVVARLVPGLLGIPATFDPLRYRGSNVDTTGDINLPDGKTKPGTVAAPLAELERGVRKLELGSTPPLLSPAMADIEFGDERVSIRRIAQEAQARGVRVAFVQMPYYTGPDTLQETDFYRGFGPVWDESWIGERADLFSDYAHLTATGADLLSDRLVAPVLAELRRK